MYICMQTNYIVLLLNLEYIKIFRITHSDTYDTAKSQPVKGFKSGDFHQQNTPWLAE